MLYATPTQTNAAVDYRTVDVKGNAYAACVMGGGIAGDVTRSLDDGVTFLLTGVAVAGTKRPTGNGAVFVIMDNDYPTNGQAFALVTGANSAALSRQVSDRCWNQISLMDTDVNAFNGAAFSDKAATDGTLFLSASPTGAAPAFTSLFKYDGTYFERCASTAVGAGTGIGELQTSPTYSTDATVFYAVTNKSAMLRSPNGGNVWIPQGNNPAVFAGWRVIDTLKVITGTAAGGSVNVTVNSGASAWTPFTAGVVGAPQVHCPVPRLCLRD